jgi:hypothetical protein
MTVLLRRVSKSGRAPRSLKGPPAAVTDAEGARRFVFSSRLVDAAIQGAGGLP